VDRAVDDDPGRRGAGGAQGAQTDDGGEVAGAVAVDDERLAAVQAGAVGDARAEQDVRVAVAVDVAVASDALGPPDLAVDAQGVDAEAVGAVEAGQVEIGGEGVLAVNDIHVAGAGVGGGAGGGADQHVVAAVAVDVPGGGDRTA